MRVYFPGEPFTKLKLSWSLYLFPFILPGCTYYELSFTSMKLTSTSSLVFKYLIEFSYLYVYGTRITELQFIPLVHSLTSIRARLRRIDPNRTCSAQFHEADWCIGNTVDSSEGTGLLIIVTDDLISLFSLSPGTWRVNTIEQPTTFLFIIRIYKLFMIILQCYPTLWNYSSWNSVVK